MVAASVPYAHGNELETVIAAWKLLLCHGEEWPYEGWDADTCTSVAREFLVHDVLRWDFPSDSRRLQVSLAGYWSKLIDARGTGQADFFPGPGHPRVLELLDPTLLTWALPVVPLAAKWNYLAGAYDVGGRLVLVDWSTSA